MTTLPAVPGVIAASRLGGDEHAAAMREAKRLPDAAKLVRGELRDAVEYVQALVERREQAARRRSQMLAERAGVHRADEAAAEAAALDGAPPQPKLPEHDRELVALTHQLSGLGREVWRAVAAVEELRVEQGAAATTTASKRLPKIAARVAELRTEAADLEAEQQQLDALVAWATHGPARPTLGVPATRVGDLRSENRQAVAANVAAQGAR